MAFDMSLYMNVRTQFKNLIAGVLVIGVTMVSPSAVHAQSQKKCIPNEVIIPLVKSKKVTSFAKIEKMLRLKRYKDIWSATLPS